MIALMTETVRTSETSVTEQRPKRQPFCYTPSRELKPQNKLNYFWRKGLNGSPSCPVNISEINEVG
jgi:hypothetical protein